MEKEVDYFDIIESLNNGLYEKFGENSIIEFLYSFSSNGYHYTISLGDVLLYNSIDDDRDFDEDKNDYEDILVYVKRKTNEYIDKIVKYKN